MGSASHAHGARLTWTVRRARRAARGRVCARARTCRCRAAACQPAPAAPAALTRRARASHARAQDPATKHSFDLRPLMLEGSAYVFHDAMARGAQPCARAQGPLTPPLRPLPQADSEHDSVHAALFEAELAAAAAEEKKHASGRLLDQGLSVGAAVAAPEAAPVTPPKPVVYKDNEDGARAAQRAGASRRAPCAL